LWRTDLNGYFQRDHLAVSCAVVIVQWNRAPTPDVVTRGWQTTRWASWGDYGKAVSGFGWVGDHQTILLFWPER
jgi:hypothetical protein